MDSPVLLSQLFAEMFNDGELRRFAGELSSALAKDLPGPGVTLKALAFEVADALRRHKLFDHDLFDRLLDERPRCRAEILQVKLLLLPSAALAADAVWAIEPRRVRVLRRWRHVAGRPSSCSSVVSRPAATWTRRCRMFQQKPAEPCDHRREILGVVVNKGVLGCTRGHVAATSASALHARRTDRRGRTGWPSLWPGCRASQRRGGAPRSARAEGRLERLGRTAF